MRKHLLFAAAAMSLLPLGAAAQQWNHQLYMDTTGNSKWVVSTLKLREVTPGQYRALVVFPGGAGSDACWGREVPAKVELQGDEQIIQMAPVVTGCSEVRYVLKADGSGGRRQERQADGAWADDGRQRILTRK